MPNLELTTEEALLLKEILESDLGDLRMESPTPIFKAFAISSEATRNSSDESSIAWQKCIPPRNDSILAVKKLRGWPKFLNRN